MDFMRRLRTGELHWLRQWDHERHVILTKAKLAIFSVAKGIHLRKESSRINGRSGVQQKKLTVGSARTHWHIHTPFPGKTHSFAADYVQFVRPSRASGKEGKCSVALGIKNKIHAHSSSAVLITCPLAFTTKEWCVPAATPVARSSCLRPKDATGRGSKMALRLSSSSSLVPCR